MNSFKYRLTSAMDSAGMRACDLSRITGISKARISQYTSGVYLPKANAVFLLAKALGVSEEYLLGLPEKSKPEKNVSKALPILGVIACGSPLLAEENYEGSIISDSALGADFCLRAKGDSMKDARIFDGDLVFIKECDMVENGDIAAVIIDSEATLKRVYYYPDRAKLILIPENKKYEPLVFEGEKLNEIRIIGKAIAFQSSL